MFQQRFNASHRETYRHWIKKHLPEMRFTVNAQYPTICTVWFEDDPEGDKMHQVGEILRTFFGAYLCGPASNVALVGPTHQSFGFWNQALIDYARRIFPLPDALQPGKPIYIGGLPDAYWPRVERAYNKLPRDLPPL